MSQLEIVSSFVEGAPPGELANVINDIKAITADTPGIISKLGPAFKKYNEEQFTSIKLPGGAKPVAITPYNALGDGRYFDTENSVSFDFDHAKQQASDVLTFVPESQNLDLIKTIIKNLSTYVNEHFSSATFGVYPINNDSKIAIIIVASKYSPNNFWSGRWRSQYIFDPSSNSLDGTIKVDVHYYEDGNVRLLTDKIISGSVTSAAGTGVAREISSSEKKYQEELNKGFIRLSEGAFKGLRRQLPVTRQKIEWDKVTSYRLGQDIGGGSSRR